MVSRIVRCIYNLIVCILYSIVNFLATIILVVKSTMLSDDHKETSNKREEDSEP